MGWACAPRLTKTSPVRKQRGVGGGVASQLESPQARGEFQAVGSELLQELVSAWRPERQPRHVPGTGQAQP